MGIHRKAAMAHCQECNAAYETRRADQDFCTPGCRDSWNNRRRIRGAMLYDYFMAHRVERKSGTGYLRAMGRLVSMWRAEDARAGRARSWNDPDSPKNPNRALVLATTVYAQR